MIIASLDVLAALSKDELLEVAVDPKNTREIQDIALHKWMALIEHDHQESMARLRALLRQSWEFMHSAGIERKAS